MNYLKHVALLAFPFFVYAHGAENCTTTPRTRVVINVMERGAKGDGQTDDTAAIQLAVNQVEGTGGTVLIPDGTYMIDALTSISIKSDLTFRMSNGAVLKAIPNSAAAYSIIKIENTSNASLIGGTLLGDRDEHLGSGGEWGMGVFINSASNISITGMTAQNAWGDGFYVRGASKNITFCSVVANNNRRQGMSIISVNGLVIRDSVFQNTNGTAPQAGLDVEPNENDTVSNVQIRNSQFLNNRGSGIQIFVAPDTTRLVKTISISGNTVTGNNGSGIWIKNSNDNTLDNNTIRQNKQFGIFLAKGSKNNTATNNSLGSRNELIDKGENTVFGNRYP